MIDSMATLRAGFGKSIITPKVGVNLVGYANRQGPSVGVHDDLHARALVLEAEGETWAICSVELCYLRESQVKLVRELVERQTGFPGSHLFLCAVHTHSGPDDQGTSDWGKPLVELIADAVIQAISRLAPARLGVGAGFLYGYSINRRWLDRPVDPFVGVIRVDNERGQPIGVVSNFGCHAVVLGYENLLISADWPGETSRIVESSLGPEAVCIVTQGGSGDINPLTKGVRERLSSGASIGTMKGRPYYGNPQEKYGWHIGDRGGGTFEEVEEVGSAVAAEVLHVMNSIRTAPGNSLWADSVTVAGSRQSDDPEYPGSVEVPPHLIERPNPLQNDGNRHLEVMLMGIEDLGLIIVGEPGEAFAETAVTMRQAFQRSGFAQTWLVGYANGWQLYLPPESSFLEGGYEVDWAVDLGLSPRLQERIWNLIQPIVNQHVRK